VAGEAAWWIRSSSSRGLIGPVKEEDFKGLDEKSPDSANLLVVALSGAGGPRKICAAVRARIPLGDDSDLLRVAVSTGVAGARPPGGAGWRWTGEAGAPRLAAGDGALVEDPGGRWRRKTTGGAFAGDSGTDDRAGRWRSPGISAGLTRVGRGGGARATSNQGWGAVGRGWWGGLGCDPRRRKQADLAGAGVFLAGAGREWG